jgi:4-hydroxybenzoate polyprenyltransferase
LWPTEKRRGVPESRDAFPIGARSAARVPPRLVAAIFDLSRGRQALLSVAQPALGAVLALGAMPSLRVILLGLLAAATGFLAVFSLNDVLDQRTDEAAARLEDAAATDPGAAFDLDTAFQRHPLAHGSVGVLAARLWVGSLAVTSAVAAAALGPACVACFAGAVALEALYCSLRSVTWMKTFVSGIMVGLGGLAGWVAVAPLSIGALALFVFLAVWEIAGRNLPNDLADYDDDDRVGLTTVSTVFGHKAAATAIFAGSGLTALSVLPVPMGLLPRLASLATVAVLMVVPSVRLLRQPTSAAAARYFNRASLVPAIVAVLVLAAILLGA